MKSHEVLWSMILLVLSKNPKILSENDRIFYYEELFDFIYKLLIINYIKCL